MNHDMVCRLTSWKRAVTLAAGAASLMMAGTVYGQVQESITPQDALFRNVGFRLQQELGTSAAEQPPQAPPSDAPAEVPQAAPACAPAAAPAEEGPWTFVSLFDDACGGNCFKDKGWQLGGWTQFGYQNNPDGAFTGNSIFLDDRGEWDRFNLNQQWLFIGKTADGTKGFDWGMRADLIYGVDGNDTQSFGNNPGRYDFQNGWDHGSYEWALPQLYGEVAFNNLSVKIGHFFTPVGYEVVPSNGNFFLSRQLTFYNSEPFTHTGVLSTYKAGDKLQLLNGWVLGMDTGFDQFNQSNAYLGGFIYQVAEKTALTYMMTGGNLGWRGDGAINSIILSQGWTDKLSTVHQFDVLNSNLRNGVGARTDFATDGIAGESVALINYAFYQINDKVKAGVRQEWYKADGTSYNTFTYGVNVFPCKNLVIRPEVRHMWSPGNDLKYGNNESLFNQTVVGIDAILTF